MKKKTSIKVILVLILFSIIFIGFNFKSIEEMFYPRRYSEYVQKYSKEYNIDEYLVYSVIKAESKFIPDAQSHKGAKGLMQISDTTAKWAEKEIGIDSKKIFEPETNIKTGCWYLARLYKEFGKRDLVIAAYNGGSGNVRKWLEDEEYSKDGVNLHDIPFEETLKYVDKVNNNYSMYEKIYCRKEAK